MASEEHLSVPDFLGIGVVRGGTTWLWRQLGRHPGAWMTPVKELDYFTRRYPLVVTRPEEGVPRQERQPNLFLQSLQRFSPGRITHYLRTYSLPTVRWRWRFYSGQLGPSWYRSLFAPAGSRLTGDITPHYSGLGEEGVMEIMTLLPRVKIILILRDPIDRDWSHAVHYLTYNLGRKRDDLTSADILAHIHDPSTRRRGDYLPMLDIWRRHVPEERFKVMFFDDIRIRPAVFLAEIHEFLGLAPFTPSGLQAKVNASGAMAMPADVARHLARLHLPALEQLAEELGGHAVAWRDRAHDLIR